MWEEMVINFALGIIHSLVKNPAKAASLKTHLLQVRDAISMQYPGE
jgi:hypothetical protein